MKLNSKFKLAIKIITSTLVGLILGIAMTYVTFGEALSSGVRLVILFTIGLPMLAATWIAKIPFIRLLFCGEMAKSTFGCWGTTSFWLAVLIYTFILFSLWHYSIKKLK